jgi:hypothetical protein
MAKTVMWMASADAMHVVACGSLALTRAFLLKLISRSRY